VFGVGIIRILGRFLRFFAGLGFGVSLGICRFLVFLVDFVVFWVFLGYLADFGSFWGFSVNFGQFWAFSANFGIFG